MQAKDMEVIEIRKMQIKMTGNQIFKQLNTPGWRWGGNDQPSVYFVTAILEQLPIDWIAGGGDTLQIYCTRNLTVPEHFMLLMLDADKVDRDGWLYTFWWD